LSSEICVVHLVWAPLGAEMLARFAASYRRVSAGLDHDLAIVFNGFAEPADAGPWAGAVQDLPHERIFTPRKMLDLAAYEHAARQLDARVLVFLNSYSRPLDDGWLAKLAEPLRDPSVGLSGASGSYESMLSAAPWFMRPLKRRSFDPFPNPHIRTNAFMLERELMFDLDWSGARTKAGSWQLESGKESVTQQVWDRGLEAVVVGRDGRAYAKREWRESGTFRVEGQVNLLVADNRTDQYASADPARRRSLEELAWGPAPASSGAQELQRTAADRGPEGDAEHGVEGAAERDPGDR
jgi:hypothetical protein